ncbi:YXWGXW repeat-containing protein [Mucilaginibacter sp. L196]|uniref:YXWGXW repeat-containing protein n=1 Tax=Mucilaginibacter sp. L196 TaxID=1641870 RepID=UPI001C20637B|nr:YXWGXW repeat-containing protein [Mucilaginibacter sp. L196]
MKNFAKACLLMMAAFFMAPGAHAQISIGISISAHIAPPALPVYVQPACPTDGYLWVPGYWAYDNDAEDYYWVPGVWVAPPNPGLLWTPAYWGYDGGVYGFHTGYWGPHVGFYGGINYGGGYGGVGFGGGAWSGGSFRYNTAVVNVNTTVIHNTYVDRSVINNNVTVNNHTSFNGPGGVTAQPRPQELAAMHDQHVAPTSQQMSHQQNAHMDKTSFASANHGKPTNVAMNKVGGAHFNPQGQRAPRANNANANRPNTNGQPNQQQHTQQANDNAHNDAQAQPQQHNAAQPQQHNAQQPKQQHQQQRQPQHKAAPKPHPQKQEHER